MYIISGEFRHKKLISPKGDATRPTSNRLRETLFNICQHQIQGAHFLDIFAGSGAMGFEALSRGAGSVTFIESNKRAIECIQKNSLLLNIQDRCQILCGDVFKLLKQLAKRGNQFEIIYADPPYRTSVNPSSKFYSETIIEWMDQHSLLKEGGLLFVEEAFESQPNVQDLKTLTLLNSRRSGPAALQQYRKN